MMKLIKFIAIMTKVRICNYWTLPSDKDFNAHANETFISVSLNQNEERKKYRSSDKPFDFPFSRV